MALDGAYSEGSFRNVLHSELFFYSGGKVERRLEAMIEVQTDAVSTSQPLQAASFCYNAQAPALTPVCIHKDLRQINPFSAVYLTDILH